jgi:recombination protein RecR
MHNYPVKLQKLVNEISKLPGIGPKMAERIALFIMKNYNTLAANLINSLEEIKNIKYCEKCFNISEENICSICKDESKNKKIICVIESPEDIVTIEKTGKYNGVYHVLYGLIDPLNNILPENLKINELINRIKKEDIIEIIFALNHTVEGDATALFIANEIRKYDNKIKITRLAKGLPTGADIRYADEITLGQAIIERREI